MYVVGAIIHSGDTEQQLVQTFMGKRLIYRVLNINVCWYSTPNDTTWADREFCQMWFAATSQPVCKKEQERSNCRHRGACAGVRTRHGMLA